MLFHHHGYMSGARAETDVIGVKLVSQHFYCFHNMSCPSCTTHAAAIYKMNGSTMVSQDIGYH